MYQPPRVVERGSTAHGELQLQQRGEHYEVIANGVFLMATHGGASERLLVRAALDHAVRPRRLVIGGLGVGFSAAEAVADRHLDEIVVVEIDRRVIGWNRRHLTRHNGDPLSDPRVRVVEADLRDWLADPATAGEHDVIVVDVDNGPGWTVRPSNGALYRTRGLRRLRERIAPGGVLAVWSAARESVFEDRLRSVFGSACRIDVPQRRGEPDRIYLAAPRRTGIGRGRPRP